MSTFIPRLLIVAIFAAVGSQGWAASTFEQAQALYGSARYEESRQAFQSFVQEHPGDMNVPAAKTKAAVCLFMARNYPEFIQEASQLLGADSALTPELADELKWHQSNVAYVQDQFAEAHGALSAYAAEHSGTELGDEAFFRDCRCLFEIGHYSEFTPAATEFLKQRSDSSKEVKAGIRYYLAMVPYMKKNWKEAVGGYEKLLADFPDSHMVPLIRYYQVESLYNMGEYEAFKQKMEPFLAQYPAGPALKQNEMLRYYLALVPFKQGDWSKAAQSLDTFVKEHPYCSYVQEAEYNAAQSLYFLESHGAFKEKAEAFLGKYPSAPKAMVASLRLNLASMPMSQGQYKEAADELAMVAEMNLTPYSVLGAKLRRAWLLKKYSESKDVNAEQAASAMAESKSLVKATLADGVSTVLSESDPQARYEVEMLILENWSNCDPHQEGLPEAIQTICDHFAPYSREWIFAKYWLGIYLMKQNPVRLNAAAEAFDAALGKGFTVNGDPYCFDVLTDAANQRVNIAILQKDLVKASELVKRIKKEAAHSVAKKRALRSFSDRFPEEVGPVE